jgi:hypothetical protein
LKFFTGLFLSLLLGAVVPSVIEYTSNFGVKQFFDYWIFAYAALVYFISFYASTLARSTLQAIGMAIAIPMVVCAGLFTFVSLADAHHNNIGRIFFGFNQAGWVVLALIMGVPSLPLILARLMFWNFKWLHRDWNLWGCNAAIILASFMSIFILDCAIYYRSWELLTPVDYPHGPAQMSDSQSIKFSIGGGGDISAVLPDGRLWVENFSYNYPFFGMWETLAPARCKTQFIGGSNWTEVASGWRESLAIQTDGSLWSSHQSWQPPDFTQSDFTRFGLETNWLHAAGGRGSPFLLLKTDGSLWIWGKNSAKTYYQGQMLDFKTPPYRLGSETNWTALFTTENNAFAKKNDGSIWNWQWTWNGNNDVSHLVQNTNTDILFQDYDNNISGGIGTNGELWVASRPWVNGNYVLQKKFQLGKNMKWKALGLNYWEDAIIALRSDGTLWKWSPLWQLDYAPEKIRATQLGNHSDWIALPDSWMGIALAADGSLWSWEMRDNIFLAPSRKPTYLGNIFAKPD